MGGHSSTQTVRKRDPESPELVNMRRGIYNMVAPLVGVEPTAGTPWARTSFSRDWQGARARVGQAWDKYDQASAAIQGLANKVTGAADTLSSLAGRLARENPKAPAAGDGTGAGGPYPAG